MSADALPITSTRFAKALEDLPISSLHAKIAELQNSITHLEQSNKELEDFVRENDDKDCYEALMENKEVIKRYEERIELVKREITEVRGLPLQPEPAKPTATTQPAENGVQRAQDVEMEDAVLASERGATASTANAESQHRNGSTGTEEEEGVYL
jgi:hypothetical protein